MFARAVIAGIAAGATAAVGVLLAIGIDQLVLPIDFYGAGRPTTDVTLMFVLIGIVPSVLVGSLFGLVALSPYAYARLRLKLGLAADVAAVVAAALVWSIIQDAAGPLRSPLANFAVILAGSVIGILPLRWIAASDEGGAVVAQLLKNPSR